MFLFSIEFFLTLLCSENTSANLIPSSNLSISRETVDFKKKFKKLTYDDLQRNDLFFIYLYYDRLNFHCPNCAYFRNYLSNIHMDIKIINFYTNIFLSSKFNSYTFPTFIIRYQKRTYKVINIQNGNHLVHVINNLLTDISTLHSIYFEPFSSIMEIGTIWNTLICYINMLIFIIIDIVSTIFYIIPEWLFMFGVFILITYLIYSIVNTIRENMVDIYKKNQ